MLKVRLQRVGRRNDPSFRVVVIDAEKGPKTGNYIEMLGSYNPRTKVRAINADRVKYWLSVGAQASDTVHNILVSEKILDGKKVNVLPKKSPVVKEKKEEEKTKGVAASEEAKVDENEAADTSPKEEAAEVVPDSKPEDAPAEVSAEKAERSEKEPAAS